MSFFPGSEVFFIMKTNEKFQTELLYYSIANDYKEATEEWNLLYSEEREGYCICGHDIKNIYYIKNKYNNTTLPVGKDCIKNFLGDKINADLDEIEALASDINREYRLIYNLSYYGIIFDKAYLKKFDTILTPDELKTIRNYAKYGVKKWGGVGIADWEKRFSKSGNHFYLTAILKKLCSHWRERKASFKYSTLINTKHELSETQKDQVEYYREKHLNTILIFK